MLKLQPTLVTGILDDADDVGFFTNHCDDLEKNKKASLNESSAQITKEMRKSKLLNSPDIEKWYKETFKVFIHTVPDNRGKKDGYYCSLVESYHVDGIPRHVIVLSFGFISSERLPYLKAAFNRGDPEAILEREKRSQEKRKESVS